MDDCEPGIGYNPLEIILGSPKQDPPGSDTIGWTSWCLDGGGLFDFLVDRMFSFELAVFLEFYAVRRGAPVLSANISGNTRKPALSTTCTL